VQHKLAQRFFAVHANIFSANTAPKHLSKEAMDYYREKSQYFQQI